MLHGRWCDVGAYDRCDFHPWRYFDKRRFLRQIELCHEHGVRTVARETARGLPVVDWRAG